jgi:hypothetical protein
MQAQQRKINFVWQNSETFCALLLFPDHLHQHALISPSIELPIKNLLPRPEVQLALRDCDHHFPAHDLPLHMRIGVVLPGAIVLVCLGRCVERSQLLQPFLVILMQPALVIPDADTIRSISGVIRSNPILTDKLNVRYSVCDFIPMTIPAFLVYQSPRLPYHSLAHAGCDPKFIAPRA